MNHNETVELLNAVNEVIRICRKYYEHGDTDLLPACRAAKSVVREKNIKVYGVLDSMNLMYLTDYFVTMTYMQIYQVIDLICGTALVAVYEQNKG